MCAQQSLGCNVSSFATWIFMLALAVQSVAWGLNAPSEPDQDENASRQRFWASYTRAEKSILKADAVLMLRGLKEKKSLQIMTGLLGDSTVEVRLNACKVMGEAIDLEGYLVKPLIGALADKDNDVRLEAARALGNATQKKDATKALIYTFQNLNNENQSDEKMAEALHDALAKITGNKFDAGTKPEDRAKAWQKWWHAYNSDEAGPSDGSNKNRPSATKGGQPSNSISEKEKSETPSP